MIHEGLKLKPRQRDGVEVYTYSKESGDFHAENIRHSDGEIVFDFVGPDVRIADISLGVPVEINIENAVAALAACHLTGDMDAEKAREAVASFMGPKRRFEFWLKESDPVRAIIDDYAHHPSEIKATIDAARQKYPDREVIAVFQPHTYSRLAAYIDGFAESLSRADKTFVTPIFGSIRENAGNVSSADLEQRIEGSEGIDMDTMDKLLQYHNAVVVFMGAGDVEKYEEKYKELLK